MIDPIRLERAFGVNRRGHVWYELTHTGYGILRGDPGWVKLARASGKPDDYWQVDDPERLRSVVERADLMRRNGRPFVAGHVGTELLAIAIGPAAAPSRPLIRGLVFDAERQVLLAASSTQPEWWLFDAWEFDPFHGSTDAKAWQAKWTVQVEAGEKPSWD